jgi:hypothetical protein
MITPKLLYCPNCVEDTLHTWQDYGCNPSTFFCEKCGEEWDCDPLPGPRGPLIAHTARRPPPKNGPFKTFKDLPTFAERLKEIYSPAVIGQLVDSFPSITSLLPKKPETPGRTFAMPIDNPYLKNRK